MSLCTWFPNFLNINRASCSNFFTSQSFLSFAVRANSSFILQSSISDLRITSIQADKLQPVFFSLPHFKIVSGAPFSLFSCEVASCRTHTGLWWYQPAFLTCSAITPAQKSTTLLQVRDSLTFRSLAPRTANFFKNKFSLVPTMSTSWNSFIRIQRVIQLLICAFPGSASPCATFCLSPASLCTYCLSSSPQSMRSYHCQSIALRASQTPWWQYSEPYAFWGIIVLPIRVCTLSFQQVSLC